MMAPLLKPNPPGSERTSQMLSTVKCSNCNQPVPFTELGEHVCAPSPATTPKLPKPSLSAIATAALLPQRLQNRVPSPISTPAFHRSMASTASASSSAQKVQDAQLPPSIDRLRANTTSTASTSQAPSSLGGQGVDAKNDKPELPSFLRIGGRSPTRQGAKSPLGPGPGAIPPVNPRPRTTSNAASIPNTRPNPPPMNPPRPPFAAPVEPLRKNSLPLPHHPPPPSFNPRSFTPQPEAMRQNTLPPSHPMNPPQPRPLPAPRGPPGPPVNHGPGAPRSAPYSEHDIDTKTGGEAGMAGVGRRGFHAAARAAMLVQNFPGRRMNPPQYLNTNVPRVLDTPPLSAGSGYSSHSPSISPYPQSPLAPSPDRHNQIPVGPTGPAKEDIVDPLAEVSRTSPVASLRMPFFDKVKNQHQAMESNLESPIDTPSTAKPLPLPFPNPTPPPPPASARESVASTSSLYSSAHAPSRSNSTATSTGTTRRALPARPLSPASESDSDVGGLAYADSSDEEHEVEDHEDEDEVVVGDAQSIKGKANPPPPLPLTQSILRSNSVASTNHVRFPSTSDRSDRSAMPIPTSRTTHSRNTSFSSASGDDESRKSNAMAIAAALGLSRTPPSDYRRLGGPGSTMGGRSSRSASGSSSGGRSAYSRTSSHSQAPAQVATAPVEPVPAIPTGIMENQMQTLQEDKTAVTFVDEPTRAGLSKSKSTGSQRTFIDKDQRPKPPLAQRSNTVQVVQSTGPRATSPPTQLPARPRTSSEKAAPAPLNVERKVKACLKCHNKIDGRKWVQVEFGVLCDGCWKNLYLPKCRRCNKPIERQAVSSSDGQLKGKYHRECFNCATCHKPFPDKSFYVFDGKPFCAYHYHEANNSLCAASFCRQPIEGPCAVSHTGERYHPEHMTCEYPGDPPCQAHLAEYWEVDGRMLCERHAHESTVGSDDEGEGEWVQSAKARKRVTRFIDLGAKLDDDEDEDLT